LFLAHKNHYRFYLIKNHESYNISGVKKFTTVFLNVILIHLF